MHEAFWHRRWEQSQIGFHQEEVNPHLQRHFSALLKGLERSQPTVFVPLCGKTQDMLWLAAQGCQVFGIELSELAVRAFFSENELPVEITQEGSFSRYQSGQIEIWCGDIFNLSASDMATVQLIYDRAALVALPDEMRARYCEHLTQILPKDCQGFLISLEYPPEKLSGPPFAVFGDELNTLLSSDWEITLLEAPAMLHWKNRFQDDELSLMCEPLYKLTKR